MTSFFDRANLIGSCTNGNGRSVIGLGAAIPQVDMSDQVLAFQK